LKLVIDASLALHLCGSEAGLKSLEKYDLIAPPLMWSESRSVLHRAVWRRVLDEEIALRVLSSIDNSPITPHNPKRLGLKAWSIASELGWAKTYDAEYIALASINSCLLVTADRRLRRGADRLEIVRLFDEF